MKMSECEKGYRRWISPDNPPVNTPKQMSDVTTNHIYAAVDLAKERDVLYAELTHLRTQLKSLEAERDAESKEIERLRLLIPTTAQAMVYHSLLMKYKALEVDLERYEKAMHLIAGTVSTPVWIKDQISNALTPPVTPSSTPQNKGN